MTSTDTPTILWSRHHVDSGSISANDKSYTTSTSMRDQYADPTLTTSEMDCSPSEDITNGEEPLDEETERSIAQNPFFCDLNVSASSYNVDGYRISASKGESTDSLNSLLTKHCETSPGKAQMKYLLHNPYEDAEYLKDQLDAVEFFVRSTDILEVLRPIMRRILPITRPYNRLSRPGYPEMTDWRSVIHTLEGIDDLRQALAMDVNLHNYRSKIDESFDDAIDVFRQTLMRAMDVPDSVATGKFIIKSGYSIDIDNLRANMQNIEVYLETAANSINTFWREKGFDPKINYSIGYVEDIGFLLMLPTNAASAHNIAFNLDKCMERSFGTENFVCYRHDYLNELDNHYHKPRAQVDSISWDIHEKFRADFLSLAESINSVIDCIGSLDVIMALASAANAHDWKKPTITDEQFFIIRGRHPTLSLSLKNFVPNNFTGEHRIKIITGANNSGKSVYAAQVALITHLAMCGSFVPAQSASIPMIKNVLAVCKSVHTTTNDLSLFASDVMKLKYAVEHLDPRSLLIIDEFGKSTRPEDGTGLLLSVIRQLLSMKPLPPHTLVVTHFHSLSQLLPADQQHIHYLESKILNDTDYSYCFKDGKATSSLARLVYKKCDTEPEIANRAQEIENILRNRESLMSASDDQQSEMWRTARKLIDRFLQVCSSSFISIRKFLTEVSEKYSDVM